MSIAAGLSLPTPRRPEAADVPAAAGRAAVGGWRRVAGAALVAVAESLGGVARSWPGMVDPACRRWDRMVASPALEAWVIAWPPGGAVELHDHGGSSGAVVVVAGELTETSVVHRGRRRPVLATTTIRPGRPVHFSGHHIHDVVNDGDVPALSVHVYAPRLTSMTYFRMTDGAVEAESTARFPGTPAVP